LVPDVEDLATGYVAATETLKRLAEQRRRAEREAWRCTAPVYRSGEMKEVNEARPW